MTTSHSQGQQVTQQTLHHPAWSYLHLSLLLPSPDQPDILTVQKYFAQALQQFLGLTGSAIPADILKQDGHHVWIRVPREDGAAVVAALGGWVGWVEDGALQGEVGWRVHTWGNWLGALVGDGNEARIFSGE